MSEGAGEERHKNMVGGSLLNTVASVSEKRREDVQPFNPLAIPTVMSLVSPKYGGVGANKAAETIKHIHFS